MTDDTEVRLAALEAVVRILVQESRDIDPEPFDLLMTAAMKSAADGKIPMGAWSAITDLAEGDLAEGD